MTLAAHNENETFGLTPTEAHECLIATTMELHEQTLIEISDHSLRVIRNLLAEATNYADVCGRIRLLT